MSACSFASGIYVGHVRHRRTAPVEHGLRMPLFMMYLDLDEVPRVFARRWLWSATRPALARFRRSDYLGDAARPLGECVRDRVEEATGRRPTGPIRLLTHLRYFGYSFNPVSFYYCFNDAGDHVEAIVAEITNTPWRERHAYVLSRGDAAAENGMHRFRFQKAFHVSPFLPMEIGYDWTFSEPGAELFVHMNLRGAAGTQAGAAAKVFDATLAMERHEITGARLAGMLARFPLMTVQVIVAIYWNALRLRVKGCPVHPHPRRRVGVHGSMGVQQ